MGKIRCPNRMRRGNLRKFSWTENDRSRRSRRHFLFFFKSKVFASVLRLADGFSSSRWKLEFFSARGSLHASSVGSLIVGHSLHRFAIESYRLSLVAALFESESTNRWIDGADVSRKFECQKSHLTAAEFDWTLKPAEFACNCICWSVRMYLLL